MLQSLPKSEKGGRNGPAQSQDAAQDSVVESHSNEEKEAGSQPNSHAVHCWARHQHRMKHRETASVGRHLQYPGRDSPRRSPPSSKQDPEAPAALSHGVHTYIRKEMWRRLKGARDTSTQG